MSSLSSQYKIKHSVLYRWRDAYREKGKAGFDQPRGPRPGAKRLTWHPGRLLEGCLKHST